MKKIFSLLAMSVLLSGCVESMALIGPATTGAGSGKIAQSAMSSGFSYAVKKQSIKESAADYDAIPIKYINKTDASDEDPEEVII